MHRALTPAIALTFMTLALAAGCTWVKLEPGAEDVLVLPESRLTPACTKLRSVKVSVADRVGALERHDEEVADDLEVLARNYAAGQGGDTVVAAGPVTRGERSFDVYRCLQGSDQRREAPVDERDGVEVLPYDGSDG